LIRTAATPASISAPAPAIFAFAVYEVIGVGILRQAWVNVDRLWAMALLVGAGATLLG